MCSLGSLAWRRKHKKKDKKRGKDRERGRERERQRKRRWEDMAHADERNRVSLADLWRDKGNKTTMFFDRVGDRDNVTYGHPCKMEVPLFRVDEWWTGGAVRARRAARNMLGLRPTRPGAPDGARGAWRYLRPAQAAKLRDRKARTVSLARHPLAAPSTPPGADVSEDFIELRWGAAPGAVALRDDGDESEGENVEEALGRRTRQFNVSTRQRPRDVDNWLAFAAFQNLFVHLQVPRPPPESGVSAPGPHTE